MNARQIFDKLWKAYAGQNPSVQKVYDLFIKEGEKVKNDHIAFRTFDDFRVNIEVLSKIFLNAGYVEKGEYHFKEKKLYAKHYEFPNDKNLPKVFISQLKMKEFSPFLQNTIADTLNNADQEVYKSENLIFSGRVWAKPSFELYNKLREESEYAAWLYVYGFMANHFTVSINSLKKLNTIEKVNTTLKKNGFLMNDVGGEIKGSPDELLEQSSIKSEIISVEFTEGIYEIPACYYEFAKRYPDSSGKLYSGFIAKSANKIFESTNFYKK
jgi:hypothetical protein